MTTQSWAPVFKHRADDPPDLWMRVERMRNPGIAHCAAPTDSWKDAPAPWHWSAFFPTADEPGIVWHVSGWARSRWAAHMEALHTYVDRYVPGVGFIDGR